MNTLVSHNGTCCIGINTDAAVVMDQALLGKYLAEDFDEGLELVAS